MKKKTKKIDKHKEPMAGETRKISIKFNHYISHNHIHTHIHTHIT